ncbi:DPP IV N-terminal domain-containing protein [Caulobacter sp.]|uniref:DPP IV N-terminal domain-containing protein n=1 Tax=Caulobacter sp. TaxID=78 RepID=UPI003BACB12D
MTQDSSNGVSRRRLFSLGGGAIAVTGAVALLPPLEAAAATAVSDDTRFATAVEGTNICAVVSPDGSTVAFDIYAMLWLQPLAGGPARRLTDDIFEIAQPDWSPDGKTLVFQSYRDGNFHIWSIDADGSNLKQLTKGAFDCREPRYSPDGRKIAFASDSHGGRYSIQILDLETGAIAPFSNGTTDEFEPSWSPDGKAIAFTVDKVRIDVQDATGARRTVARVKPSSDRFNAASVASPAFTPDGSDVIYTAIEGGKAELRSAASGAIVRDEDVFPFRVSWLPSGEFLYTADGKIRRRKPGAPATAIAFSVTVPVIRPRYDKKSRDFLSAKSRPVVGIGSPALSPDGTRIVFRALNDLYLLPIGGKAAALTRDQFSKVDPAWSPDGKTLAYSTDKGGSLDIWLRDMASGETRQLTHFDGAAVSSAWSRDGKSLAFLSQNGGLFIADAMTGETRRLYADLWEPGKPTWGPGDKAIAYAAFKPYSARFREGLSEILTVDVETGKGTYAPVAPHRSLGTRGDDGPVWSPDGAQLAFVFASRLHVAPVDAAGKFTGPPRPLNDEVTDAVSYSGDGKLLLYISAGQLKLIPATGGAPRVVPHGLTWTNLKPKERLLVQAGKLWDGRSPELRHDVDVLIEGGKIVSVSSRGATVPDGVQVVDARASTVMPGLIDMHTHRQMQGYGYGDREGRLWLSLGVTTTRSPGGPAYHTVEDQEAIESGARVGPRYYATGEAIDGSRIFYNFMRPVTEPGQMALEMKRAEALSYDLIKTYVRLSGERQKEVVDWAHAKGLPLTSHYHYPALGLGMDGMEHLGATSRTGYSRTVSALGNIYQDVNAAFLASKAARTPTLFTSTALFGDDRSLVDDERVRALYPPWEYARLLERAKLMAATDRTTILASLERNIAEVARTVRAGGRIVTGTDSPIDFNAVSLHMNLRAMVRFGLSPFEALVTATSASADYLDEPLGVVAPGAYADLIVVDGDPLVRIEDAAKVQTVIKHGQIYTIADLMAPFASHAMHASLSQQRRFVCEASADYWWHEPAYLAQAKASCCDGACGFTPNLGSWA